MIKKISSIHKSLKFLEYVCQADHGFRLAEAARVLGISSPAALNYTNAFLDEGYIVKDVSSGKFKASYKIVSLGFMTLKNNRIFNVSTPILEVLQKEIDSPVHLAIKKESVGLCINVVGDDGRPSISTIGSEFDLYCTALGRAMLAHSDDDEVDLYFEKRSLVKKTPKTTVDKEILRKIVLKTKEEGYAIDKEESKLGLCSMAVPIFDDGGKLLAALSIIVPFDCRDEDIAPLYSKAKSTASDLSKVLSGLPLEELNFHIR